MAFTAYHNILGATATTQPLLAPGDNANDIKSIVLANVHATADATVSLSISKLSDPISLNASEIYYLMKTVAIPSDTSLLLDSNDMLAFDNSNTGYHLFITVGGSDTVDVLIRR